MSHKAIEKYLANYAEIEIQVLNKIKQSYQHACIIPICNEAFDCLETIFSKIKTDKLLIITVINSPKSHENSKTWQIHNKKWIETFEQSISSSFKLNQHMTLLKFNKFHDVILIDRNTQGLQIDEKQGVGLARKIAADCALKLFQLGKIINPWIFSTDADVILPITYFTHDYQSFQNYSAIVLDFKHITNDKKLHQLQYLYDLKMRYYHAGITYAGSQYDYIPLGSALIVNMLSYAQVRGFPKKNAAEDFYLLNKLAKTKPIKYKIKESTITIKSRLSNRVPFGTGPALNHISSLTSLDEYTFYHPNCFTLLKHWHAFLHSLWQEELIICIPKEKNLQELYQYFNCAEVFKKSQNQITSRQRWSQFVHQWFDAFRTLKAIHFFDKKFARLTHKQLLNHPSFAKVNGSLLQEFIERQYGITLHT